MGCKLGSLFILLVTYTNVSSTAKLEDQHPECERWALSGECIANPQYMLQSCKRSCRRVDKLKRDQKKPRMRQNLSEVASILHRFESCSGLGGGGSEVSEREGENNCVERCQGHADCLNQCRKLSPKSLHSLLRECAPWSHISNVSASRGMHVTCVIPAPETCSEIAIVLVMFANGRTMSTPLIFDIPHAHATSLAALIAHTETLVKKPQRGQLYQAAGFFTSRGRRILNLQTLMSTPLVFMMEGGQWVWPGVRIGHEVELHGLRNPEEVTIIRTAQLVPAVFEIENFLKPEESAHMISRVEGSIKKSPVALKDADQGKQAKEFRTSSQRFLPTTGDATLESVDARVQELTRVPITHAEDIQVLRYNLMEHYSAHHDFFDPAAYQNNQHTLNMVQHGANNRMATVFFYLTNVTRGGETNFPQAGGLPRPRDFFDCSRGFSSYPKADKVIIFYSMLPSGEMDDNALHGGCDVLEGQKWSANFWLWNKPNPANAQDHKRRQLAKSIGAVGKPENIEVKYDSGEVSDNSEFRPRGRDTNLKMHSSHSEL